MPHQRDLQDQKLQTTLFVDVTKIKNFFMEYKHQGLTSTVIKMFQDIILEYHQKHGRKLPWRETRNPYYILVSEMMLQQTQVERVVPKYKEFIDTFPDFEALSMASTEKVLSLWRGLGYNRRALALKKTAKIIMEEYQGQLPSDITKLRQLPGIGEYTASAIMVFAFNKPAIVIETNIRAVYIYFFFNTKEGITDKELIPFIEKTMDSRNPRRWYNALMDYGVMLKKNHPNPNRKSRHYRKQSPFKGSNREIRGNILKLLLDQKTMEISDLSRQLSIEKERMEFILKNMEKEGFLTRVGNQVTIKSKQ